MSPCQAALGILADIPQVVQDMASTLVVPKGVPLPHPHRTVRTHI